jgi:hypothetical protein
LGVAPTCWAVTTGEAGMVSQAMGLAEAVGLSTVQKTVHLRAPWRWLPGHLCPAPLAGLDARSDPIRPPWPDLLITCGRRSVAVAIAVSRLSRGRTFTVHVQDPRVPPRCFDMVVPPEHDGLSGDNVYPTLAALHRVTPQKLAQAAEHFRARFESLPRPLVAALIGGDSRAYRFRATRAAELADELIGAAEAAGAGLIVTASRRTGPDSRAALEVRLQGDRACFWQGEGENPYLGMLALADFIVVTEDSISMVSEACATGRPVHIAAMEGGNRRFAAFHERLRAAGVTRPFRGRLMTWSYEPIDETRRIAELVRARLRERSPGAGSSGADGRRVEPAAFA